MRKASAARSEECPAAREPWSKMRVGWSSMEHAAGRGDGRKDQAAKQSLYIEKATTLPLSSVVFSLVSLSLSFLFLLIAFPFLLAHKMPPVTQ